MTLQGERRNGSLKVLKKQFFVLYHSFKIFGSPSTTIMTNIKIHSVTLVGPTIQLQLCTVQNEAVLFLIRIFIVVSHFNIENTV